MDLLRKHKEQVRRLSLWLENFFSIPRQAARALSESFTTDRKLHEIGLPAGLDDAGDTASLVCPRMSSRPAAGSSL